jgi:hypothetical protein
MVRNCSMIDGEHRDARTALSTTSLAVIYAVLARPVVGNALVSA